MTKVLYGVFGGLIIAVLLLYKRAKGVKIDSKDLEKIRKDIRDKPIDTVIDDINSWLR